MKVALVGYGYWGPNVARQLFENKKVSFGAICDKSVDRLDKARQIFMQNLAYLPDYRIVLNDPSIDAVFLAVETSAHFELAKQALLAGKHVYVEKPLTSSVTEAEELRSIAVEMGLIIHVDHIMVYHPYIQKIKSLLDSGELGEILYFDAQRMNLGQIKKDVSSMWDLAVHDLSIIEYLTGSQEPRVVSALGERYYNPKETLTFLTLRYDNFIAHIKSSWVSPLKERRLIVAGTKKMVVFDDMKVTEKLMIYDKGVDIIFGENIEYNDYVVKTRTGDVLIPFVHEEDALFKSIDHFIDCALYNRASITGPEAAIHVIKILEKADERMIL